MNINFYNMDGYFDVRNVLKLGMPFNYIFGGRGTGKTFSAIETVLTDKIPFVYSRRLQKQVDNVMNPELSPFTPVEDYLGVKTELKPLSKDNKAVYLDGERLGITASLQTFSSLRGFSAEYIKIWIHDEFIPESTEAKLRGDEGDAYLNAYETINRNRELKGEKPLISLCLANANDIGNPIFMQLNLIKVVEKMKLHNKLFYLNKERGIFIAALDNSPISVKKRDTALYRLTKGSDFEKMAIDNMFLDDSIAVVKSKSLIEYKPFVIIADCCIYKHKSNNTYYMSEHKSGSPPEYTTAKADLERFQRAYYYLWNAYLDRRIEFENKLCSLLFERLW